ncbi:MAG: HIT family protein [Acholeplasmatales bacterium]|jgi:histidine triad (HIT) family protein|nr:HIT family protein [Acholeplasmatales bacterium]
MSLFTKIINREIPAYIIYENSQTIAFLDISQATPGHLLVVPKEEAKDIFTISAASLSDVVLVIQMLAQQLKNKLGVNDLNIISNNGELAGQSIAHLHFHLIPRYIDDKISFIIPNHQNITKKEDFLKLQELLKIA